MELSSTTLLRSEEDMKMELSSTTLYGSEEDMQMFRRLNCQYDLAWVGRRHTNAWNLCFSTTLFRSKEDKIALITKDSHLLVRRCEEV